MTQPTAPLPKKIPLWREGGKEKPQLQPPPQKREVLLALVISLCGSERGRGKKVVLGDISAMGKKKAHLRSGGGGGGGGCSGNINDSKSNANIAWLKVMKEGEEGFEVADPTLGEAAAAAAQRQPRQKTPEEFMRAMVQSSCAINKEVQAHRKRVTARAAELLAAAKAKAAKGEAETASEREEVATAVEEQKVWDTANRASFVAVAATSKCLKKYPNVTSDDISVANAALIAATDAAEKAAMWDGELEEAVRGGWTPPQ
jgi:hypothetical protein